MSTMRESCIIRRADEVRESLKVKDHAYVGEFNEIGDRCWLLSRAFSGSLRRLVSPSESQYIPRASHFRSAAERTFIAILYVCVCDPEGNKTIHFSSTVKKGAKTL